MKFLTSELLNKYGVRHGFSTSTGFSYKLDPGEVMDPAILAQWFPGFSDHKIALLDLQNSNSVQMLAELDGSITVYKVDGAVTTGQITMALTVADCIPIFIYDTKLGITAIVHGGWRGLSGGIINNALDLMFKAGSKANELVAVLGPAICGNCYEFGPEAPETFPEVVIKRVGQQIFVDLKQLAKLQLSSLGVSQIDDLEVCVNENAKFDSYRRDKVIGRNLAFIQNKALKNA